MPALAAVQSLGFSPGYCLSQKLNRVPGEHSRQMKSSARFSFKKVKRLNTFTVFAV